jgi:hypothetical protein
MPPTNRLIVKDDKWDEIVKEHKRLGNTVIKIGYWGSGGPRQNLAYRAAIHTYGIPKGIRITTKMRKFLHAIGIHVKNTTKYIFLPQRPFMQNAMDNNINIIIDFIQKNYIQFLKNKINLDTFLKRIGLKHEGQIKNSIRQGVYEKLHPVTIARKGSSKPLIDKGGLLNGAKYKVEQVWGIGGGLSR